MLLTKLFYQNTHTLHLTISLTPGKQWNGPVLLPIATSDYPIPLTVPLVTGCGERVVITQVVTYTILTRAELFTNTNTLVNLENR